MGINRLKKYAAIKKPYLVLSLDSKSHYLHTCIFLCDINHNKIFSNIEIL
jgi:hypothetical protein